MTERDNVTVNLWATVIVTSGPTVEFSGAADESRVGLQAYTLRENTASYLAA
ncbi:MAG TPA: hypothetical protein VI750_02345 [Pyrinomonadaceae bacterium]|nr:hypothetical protein [Pyrinomonadaceae bacterium]